MVGQKIFINNFRGDMDITDLYRTCIQKNFDDDQAEILAILKANPKKTLKLISYYKGLPLAYTAAMVSLDRGIADLDVRAEQAYVIEKSRSVFIRSPLFKHDVFAHAQYASAKKKAVTVGKFCYVEIMAERRNFIRVSPGAHTNSVIESPLGSIEGDLYDLSLSGLNIAVHHSCQLEISAEMSIRFILKNLDGSSDLRANVQAKLVAISGDMLPRNYRFSMNPDKFFERQLSKYIIDRQIEIIREIKEATS